MASPGLNPFEFRASLKHIYVGAYGIWNYVASTTWARTCKEARAAYADEKGLCLGNVKALFAKN